MIVSPPGGRTVSFTVRGTSVTISADTDITDPFVLAAVGELAYYQPGWTWPGAVGFPYTLPVTLA